MESIKSPSPPGGRTRATTRVRCRELLEDGGEGGVRGVGDGDGGGEGVVMIVELRN